ncbi:TRAP transporter small permease [uncultured Cohaesibacter sp.]|uniref:TRAP transporter small permease n=1 Tax=uncultured Cohaesibacter sp. TaxID=1002546 RepID=UPI0029C6B089|nr:TRAP transporter small permease [uncultured Cohaesibacter sp.]
MTLTKTLQTAETVVGIICLGSMFVIICANVVMRYVASDPIFWAEELSNFLFVWAGFLSCAYILAEDRHIRVTLFVNLLPPMAQTWINLVLSIVLVVMFGSFVWPCIVALESMNVTAALQISETYPYSILPLSMGLCCVHSLVHVLRLAQTIRVSYQEKAA